MRSGEYVYSPSFIRKESTLLGLKVSRMYAKEDGSLLLLL